MVGEALSDRSLRQFEPTLLEQVDTFVKLIGKAAKTSSPVNMTPSSRHLGFDTIGQLGFGYDLKLQTDEEHHFLKKAIVFSNFRINLSMQYPPLIDFRPDYLVTLLPNSIRKRLLAVVEKMIAARLAQPIDAKHDLLSFIAPKLETDLKEIQKSDLWPEAVFFFGAGT
jgi:cytochrome P450